MNVRNVLKVGWTDGVKYFCITMPSGQHHGCVVLTFEDHPLFILRSEAVVARIVTTARRIKIISTLSLNLFWLGFSKISIFIGCFCDVNNVFNLVDDILSKIHNSASQILREIVTSQDCVANNLFRQGVNCVRLVNLVESVGKHVFRDIRVTQ